MQKKSLSLILEEMVFFYISILFSGTTYVIPQIFLLKYYPENKTMLLALLVIAGTLASILGVWLSTGQKCGQLLNDSKSAIISLFLLLTVLFNFQYFIQSITLFLLVLIAVKFISNFLYNYLDTGLSNQNSEFELKHHVNAMVLYQLLAYISAPVFFSAFFFLTPVNIVVPTLIAIISILFLSFSSRMIPSFNTKTKTSPEGSRLNGSEKCFLIYVFLIHAGVILVSSLAIYILQDYYQMKNAVQIGGALIGYISFIAVLTIFAVIILTSKRLEKRGTVLSLSTETKGNPLSLSSEARERPLSFSDETRENPLSLSTKSNVATSSLLIFGSLLFFLKLSESVPYVFFIGTVTGIALGLFLHSTRTYANQKANMENKANILMYYNNLPNIGTLLSLGLTFVFTIIAEKTNTNFDQMILIVIMMVFVSCFVSILVYAIQFKNRCKRKNENETIVSPT
ncbi:membrane hypothetical protein [Desulfamplus magnetovallimortis]|uniref:Uncharacterized protein n=1 Tax=Desulfamplus magnetovallimortis TaxID=1246637 RepID=A0A1W1HAM9_9BACT|nr:hypothetical protein [Desulfamplus magnetovallimortis]SLM29489.1 membrane hypothetical protein [Desulfamplus magnetovallimortis]